MPSAAYAEYQHWYIDGGNLTGTLPIPVIATTTSVVFFCNKNPESG